MTKLISIASHSSVPEYSNLNEARKTEDKNMRKKYGLRWKGDNTFPTNHNYTDRADNRRETVGSDNPYEKTEVASEDL